MHFFVKTMKFYITSMSYTIKYKRFLFDCQNSIRISKGVHNMGGDRLKVQINPLIATILIGTIIQIPIINTKNPNYDIF